MAIYRFNVGFASRQRAESAHAHAIYILRQKRYRKRAEELRHIGVGNMPSWVTCDVDGCLHFWKAVDAFERRNARLCWKWTISLPRELSLQEQVDLIDGFIEQEIGGNHPFSYAIHESIAADGGVNPHVHFQFSARVLDSFERTDQGFFKRYRSDAPSLGGARKEASWEPEARLLSLRQSWQLACNEALMRAGVQESIDAGRLSDRGIQRPAEPKLKGWEIALWKQGVRTDAVEAVLMIRALRGAKAELAGGVRGQRRGEIEELRDISSEMLRRQWKRLRVDEVRLEEFIAELRAVAAGERCQMRGRAELAQAFTRLEWRIGQRREVIEALGDALSAIDRELCNEACEGVGWLHADWSQIVAFGVSERGRYGSRWSGFHPVVV